MTSILRVKTRWSGFTGGPGYTVMHFNNFGDESAGAALNCVTRVHAFFNAIKQAFPEAVRLDVEGEVDIIEDSDGKLVDSVSVAAPAPINGTGTGTYSAVSGTVVNWKTNGVRKARKVRGRTFLVPLSGNSYDGQGTLNGNLRTLIQTAAQSLADVEGAPDLGVYARPTAKGATDGVWFGATNASVPATVAMLTSRRD